MAAGTIVTVISLPIYAYFYRWCGGMGLAFASDIGIAMQTLAIAGLLHRREMVSLASLDYREMGRCVLAGCVGGSATWFVFSWLAGELARGVHLPDHGRVYNLVVLMFGGLVWGGISLGLVRRMGSELPRIVTKRLRLA